MFETVIAKFFCRFCWKFRLSFWRYKSIHNHFIIARQWNLPSTNLLTCIIRLTLFNVRLFVFFCCFRWKYPKVFMPLDVSVYTIKCFDILLSVTINNTLYYYNRHIAHSRISYRYSYYVIIKKTTVLKVNWTFHSLWIVVPCSPNDLIVYMQHHKHKLTEPLTMQSKFSINRQ